MKTITIDYEEYLKLKGDSNKKQIIEHKYQFNIEINKRIIEHSTSNNFYELDEICQIAAKRLSEVCDEWSIENKGRVRYERIIRMRSYEIQKEIIKLSKLSLFQRIFNWGIVISNLYLKLNKENSKLGKY